MHGTPSFGDWSLDCRNEGKWTPGDSSSSMERTALTNDGSRYHGRRGPTTAFNG